jgi:hypothetical protein
MASLLPLVDYVSYFNPYQCKPRLQPHPSNAISEWPRIQDEVTTFEKTDKKKQIIFQGVYHNKILWTINDAGCKIMRFKLCLDQTLEANF